MPSVDLYKGKRHPLEWYEYLPEPYRSQAIENFDADTFTEIQRRRGGSPEKCGIADSIFKGFVWSNAPEEHDYWSDLRDRLESKTIELVAPTRAVDKDELYSIPEWFEMFPEPYRAQALTNLDRHPLTDIPGALRNAAESLLVGFKWGCTSEGYSYWREFRLSILENRVELKTPAPILSTIPKTKAPIDLITSQLPEDISYRLVRALCMAYGSRGVASRLSLRVTRVSKLIRPPSFGATEEGEMYWREVRAACLRKENGTGDPSWPPTPVGRRPR